MLRALLFRPMSGFNPLDRGIPILTVSKKPLLCACLLIIARSCARLYQPREPFASNRKFATFFKNRVQILRFIISPQVNATRSYARFLHLRTTFAFLRLRGEFATTGGGVVQYAQLKQECG